MGVNAAVIGILISAFYFPIWTSSILAPVDFALAAILFTFKLRQSCIVFTYILECIKPPSEEDGFPLFLPLKTVR